ncbi:YitT family protein [Microbacterium laevaniformans]|nr:YitT family protein [Microbacterium laevaniformans]
MDAVNTPAEGDPTTGPTLVFEAKTQDHSVAEDILGILTGTFLVSVGLHLLHAAGAVTGGTAGLSLLLGYATGWPFWVLFAAVNVPFALLAVWRRGWDFTIRTIVCIALVSVLAPLHDALFPISGLQPLYGTLAGNLLAGVGVLILFRHRGSVGGINIVGLEIQDRTGFRAGWTMMIFDVLIVALALLVVPWPNVVMSAVGAILLNLVLALNHRPGRYLGR